VSDREDEAVQWACARAGSGEPGLCRAFWLESGGEFEVVAVISGFTQRNVDLHIAAADGWRADKRAIILFNSVFQYVFNRLGAARTTGLIKLSNRPARNLAEHLGFELEGVLREAFVDDDLCVYGFLRQDYEAHRWFRTNPHQANENRF
jgi:hypothetical protein